MSVKLVILFLHSICIISYGLTKRATMALGCDGMGTLTFDGHSYPIKAMKDFPYPTDITLRPENTYEVKASQEYQGVNMHWVVGPIHSGRGAFIHSGSLDRSGLQHLCVYNICIDKT